MNIPWSLLIPLSLVSAATYDFAWDARSLEYTCDGLKEETGKEWIKNGDFCVHFSDDRFSWKEASEICGNPSFSSSIALSELSWLQLMILPVATQRYWTALRFNAVDSLLDGTLSTSIYNPSWADTEPTSLNDACIAMNLSPASSKIRGWHFEDCSIQLPVICQTFACIGDEFRCSDNTHCIPRSAVNDGFVDCLDGSDEYSNVKISSSASLNISRAVRLMGRSDTSTQSTQRSSSFDCPLPQDLRNVGIVGPAGFGVGDVISWQCNSGFSPRVLESSMCVKGVGWEPPIECNKLNCFTPDTMNLTHITGTLQGDRAIYTTQSTAMNSELTRVAVCDEGAWVYMNDELDEICVAAPFKFGHFDKDKFATEDLMNITCEKDFHIASSAGKCGEEYTLPICNPDSINPSECDGTIHKGPPLFVRDWCACKGGGVLEGGECKGFTDSCSASQDTCTNGKVCQRNETAGEDYHCSCPTGSCLYPFNECANEAFLPSGSFDKNMGECATIRCSLDELKALVPTNCRVTTYAKSTYDYDWRIGATDVICSHVVTSGKVQTKHSVLCEDGQWTDAEFNKVCNATKGLIYDDEGYSPFEITSVFYSSLPNKIMYIRCNGNGEWIGEVPTETCFNGVLSAENNLVRCICNDGYYGEDCSRPCDKGTVKGDGSCECNTGFHGEHCEVEEGCSDSTLGVEANGENLDLVFIIDLYKDGFDQFITNEQSGLVSSIQQLIRDISYYDNKFVRNITLITFGMGKDVSSISIHSFEWKDVDQFVGSLSALPSGGGQFCNFGLDDVLSALSTKLETLPRGSIVNMFTLQPSMSWWESILDTFVSNGLVANIITDSSALISGCATDGGVFTHYQRLARLTGGYFLDGMDAAQFMLILPRFYKSSTVLIPAVVKNDNDYGDFPFVIDSAAQSLIVHSFDEGKRSGLCSVTGHTSPSSFDVKSTKDSFQVLYNNGAGNWQSMQGKEGYHFHSLGDMDWQGALTACEAMGGTVADFINDNVCDKGVAAYWVPIRYNRASGSAGWEAFYRGTTIPVTTHKFRSLGPPSSGSDCAAFDCTDFKWFATSCGDNLPVLCQKSVFDPQKTASLSTDQIREDAGFYLAASFVKDKGTWFSVRVQSNVVFDYKLTDLNNQQVAQIVSGNTRLRMATTTGEGSPNTNDWTNYAAVIEETAITRSSAREGDCIHFPTGTTSLFCRSTEDVTVQVSNRQGVIRSFIARCTPSSFPISIPPSDCASTGCILENTGYCYVDEYRNYKCSCISEFEGQFCEVSQSTDTSCESYLHTQLNDVARDSNIVTGGCGCTDDMTSCVANTQDACGSNCSPYSSCQSFEILATTTPKAMQPTQAVGACVCNPGFEGEFCNQRQSRDCSGKPCHNGATCVDMVDPNGFICLCETGFTGEFCDIPLGLCSVRTCENGGICYNIDPLSTFCLCKNGYTGVRCEHMLNLGCFNGGISKWDGTCQCPLPWDGQYCTVLKDPMPLEVCGCSNGSTCVYDEKEEVKQISCKCPVNYVGEKCETLQTACSLNPCGAHGTCIAQPNVREYKCKCKDDYGGDLCDVFVGGDGCDKDSCLNEGICKEGVCDCPSPYTGTHCQNTLPCDGFCLNGGTCDRVDDKPVCRCTLKFTGKQCEKEEKDKSYNLEISMTTQQLGYDINNLSPVFSVCSWIRATPRRTTADPVMPIFEMNFGGDQLRVTTANATVRGHLVGDLSLNMQLWQQFCIRCTSTSCDAFANGISLGINLAGGFTHQSSTLFIAPSPRDGEIMLNAEISRFSIYNHAITDKEAAAFAFECASTVGKGDTADDLWWSLLDPVPRSALTSPGLCESSPCWPGTCGVPVDKFPPIVTFCPSDIFKVSTRPLSIKWQEPVFEDEHSEIRVESNYRSGDIFVWGEHHVVYTATDPSNNTARCEFDIYIAPNECKTPLNPWEADMIFKETFDGESGSYSMASVKCKYERYPFDGPKFYVCDYMGQWRRSYYSPVFLPPSCGKVSDPEGQTMDGSVQFKTDSYNCEEDRKKMEDAISTVISRICPNGQDGCAEVSITECPAGRALVQKADDDEPILRYEITILSSDSLLYQNIQNELEKIDGVDDIQISEPVYKCNTDTPLPFDSNGYPFCAEVPPGFYYKAVDQSKIVCPIDQYQDKSNQDSCKDCPDGTITEAEGATKPSDCYENCKPGSWCNFDSGVGADGAFDKCCELCPKGRYASGWGTLVDHCTPCKDGMTTKNEGAISDAECYWPCEKGQDVDDVTGLCRDCEQGKYKDSDKAGQCKSCVSGLTTSRKKSTSSSDCSLLYCPPNTYVNPNAKGSPDPNNFKLNDFCLPCEMGMLQPLYNSTSCDKCPDTPDINNQLPPTCRLENECSPQLEDSCGEGRKCLKWPDNNYYHCVDDNSEEENEGGSLSWWQIILIVAGSCLAVAALVAVAVIVAMRCCNVGKKANKDEETLSHGRRSTADNFTSTVPDKEDEIYDPLPTPMLEMPPVHIDPSYVYNKPLTAPSTPAVEQLPAEYYRQSAVPTASVVRMRKRMSNVSRENVPRQSRPFSTDTISSVPSIRSPMGRTSGNFFVPSVTIRSTSESSIDSFSIGSVSSRGSETRPRLRPDSSQIVHALVDALDENRFRGGWDRESSIL